MSNKKSNTFLYGFVKFASAVFSKLIFKRKYLRNEIKGKKGPFVIIGNHEAALDFTSLIGTTREHITFVVSDSFYNTLPVKGFMKGVGVIPKQQFQTTLHEISAMRNTLKNNGILMLYPAGLMSENGLPTPIPEDTYEFLRWLDADVYAAKISGTYFCTPKWSGKTRRGRTYLDVYKLFDKEALHGMEPWQIKEAVDGALYFDAYREQEKNMVKYTGGDNIEGLENVLYICPNCKSEFSVRVKNKKTIYCKKCGFEHTSDKYGFLHNTGKVGEEIRYVSDWARFVSDYIREKIECGELCELSSYATVQTIDYDKKKYVDVGRAKITLLHDTFIIDGKINGEEQKLEIPTKTFASLPFKPGCRIEIQHGKTTYRCVLDDGRLAQKFVDMVKIYYDIHHATIKPKATV